MKAIRVLGVLACLAAAIPMARADDNTSSAPRPAGRLKLHDSARPVTHLARSEALENASPGVVRPESVRRTILADAQANAGCDSILCPGYVMLGVGF